VKKKDQIEFLMNIYNELSNFEEECGNHTSQEHLYLRNALNSVDVCLSSKQNKKNKKRKGWI
jgi:hypothetical protein